MQMYTYFNSPRTINWEVGIGTLKKMAHTCDINLTKSQEPIMLCRYVIKKKRDIDFFTILYTIFMFNFKSLQQSIKATIYIYIYIR